ncbi:glycosyltransferase family 4 protein [Micromonosporaceae bacterium Da 78-11]
MRVLMLSTNFHPVIGGAETYCRDLAMGLAGRGHDVTVFTSPAAGAPAREVVGGVTVLRALPEPGGDVSVWENGVFGLLPTLQRAVRLQDVDVVHANSQDTAVLGAIVSLQHGMPLVVTSHEVGREHGPLGPGRGRLVFGALPVHAYIAVSDYYQQVAAALGARRVHRIDLGVDLDRFHPGDTAAARRRCRVERDEFVIGCIARFKPRKGLLELLGAVAQVRALLPNVRLLLAGTVSSASRQYAAQLRARITTLGLSRSVRIVDCGHDQVAGLLRACDVYVQPSHVEGLGLAVVEAMACGVPVIVSDTDGLREVVRPQVTGLMVPVGDAGGIADAVLRLAQQPGERARLAAAGRAEVADRFGLARMVARTEDLYRDLLAQRPAPATVDGADTGWALAGKAER